MLLALGAFAVPAAASVSRFESSVTARELYTQDVFHGGANPESDYISTLRLDADWLVQTPRSSARFEYIPEYAHYATFDTLNHLDHQVTSLWRFTPGRRSSFAVAQTFIQSYRQTGFHDFAGDEGVPVVQQTRRDVWSLEPSFGVDLSRRWRLDSRAIYREQRYASADLVDVAQVGLEVAPTTMVGEHHRLGGRLRGDAYNFTNPSGTTPIGDLDRFVSTEILWSRDDSRVFNYRVGLGLFRGSGQHSATVNDPVAHLSGTWGGRRSKLYAGYDLGYSSSGGLGGASQSHSWDLEYTATWGRGFSTSLHGSHIDRTALEAAATSGSDLHGTNVALEVAYRWRNGLALMAQGSRIRQTGSSSTSLDYLEVFCAIAYVPRARPAATAPSGATL